MPRHASSCLPTGPKECQKYDDSRFRCRQFNLFGRDMRMGATAQWNNDKDFAIGLHGVLSEIDTARWRDDMAESLASQLENMHRWLKQEGRHVDVAHSIENGLATVRSSNSRTQERWLSLKKQLQPAYDALSERLKSRRVHVPSLRPTNYGRSLFHAASAVVAVMLIHWVADAQWLLAIAGAWALFVWSCEAARVKWPWVNEKLLLLLGPIAHAHEVKKVNSATWYATALFLVSLTQSLPLCTVAVVVLGFADPMAALVGRRFGRIRLVHGRSLEGTLAFMVTGVLVSFLALWFFYPQLGAGASIGMALGAGIFGGIAELLSLRWDDNFTIPLSSAAGAFLMATALGAAL